jgi:chemotaxis signal transduction protein
MASTGGDPYLLFRAGSYDLAVPAAKVRHLELRVTPFRLEGAPSWLAGMVELADRGIPVVDVARRMGMPPDSGPNSEQTVIILENPRQGGPFPEIGLLVERIADTVRIRVADARQLRRSSSLPIRDWVEGAYRGRSRATYLLDLEKLIPAEIALLLDHKEWREILDSV